MTARDDTSGLPVLPAGQWWEVVETRMDDYTLFYIDPANFRVEIVTGCYEPPVMVYGPWPWSKGVETKPAKTKKTIACAGIFKAGGMPASELTPRLIRKAAYGLVQERNRKARTTALLGSYPPKKLEHK